MPGGLISERQREFMEELCQEPNLAPSVKKSEQISLNMHGRFYLKHKIWPDAQALKEEDLLGLVGGETNGGEPLAHFHLTWSALRWARIDAQRNARIQP